MAYLGRQGVTAPLTSADIPDNSITSAKIVAGTIEASDVAADMATQAELDLKAPLASPPFTGTPTGITAAHITSGVLPVGVTGGSGLTALGTVLSGIMNNTAGELFKHKIYSHTHTTGLNDGGTAAITFGSALAIPSSGNPDGSKFVILVGGGRWHTGNATIVCSPSVTVKEGSDFTASTTTTEGERVPYIWTNKITGVDEYHHGWVNAQLYENDSGSAQDIWIRTSMDIVDTAGQNPAWYANSEGGTNGVIGFIMIKIA